MKWTKSSIALTLLLLLGFIWGTGYSIARFATVNGVSPLGYSFWQALGPAFLLLFLTKTTGSQKTVHITSHWQYYLICGLTGIVIPNTNMYFAAAHLPAGILAVIVNTVPIIAYPLALFLRVENFQITRFFAVLLAITGLLLIILPGSSLPTREMAPWALTALLTPFSFAFCAVYIAKYRPMAGDSLSHATGTLIAASLLLIPFVLLTHQFYFFHFPLKTPDYVILLEILLSSIGYILFFQLIKIAGPVFYSLVDTVVATTGLFWGYVIFHETLNAWTTPAVICILCALLLVIKEKHRFVTRETRLC